LSVEHVVSPIIKLLLDYLLMCSIMFELYMSQQNNIDLLIYSI